MWLKWTARAPRDRISHWGSLRLFDIDVGFVKARCCGKLSRHSQNCRSRSTNDSVMAERLCPFFLTGYNLLLEGVSSGESTNFRTFRIMRENRETQMRYAILEGPFVCAYMTLWSILTACNQTLEKQRGEIRYRPLRQAIRHLCHCYGYILVDRCLVQFPPPTYTSVDRVRLRWDRDLPATIYVCTFPQRPLYRHPARQLQSTRLWRKIYWDRWNKQAESQLPNNYKPN